MKPEDYSERSIEIDGAPISVEERGVMWTPFCQLLRFREEGGEDDPKILLVAPMSGHYATLLRATARHVQRPAQILSHVNEELARDNPSSMFVTLFCAVLDTRTGRIVFSSGGHTAPVLVRPVVTRTVLASSWPARSATGGYLEFADTAPGTRVQ